VDYVLSCPAEAITMKAEERKPDEKHLYREEIMLRYMKSICCVVFCGLCEEACPKTLFMTTSKDLFLPAMKRRFFMER
jgi:NADH-quinone oxidoreductase subunit I